MSLGNKLFFMWLNDNCDHAGIISPDFEVASLQIGEAVNEKNIAELGNRLQRLPDGFYIIVGFIKFQFGDIKLNVAGKGMSNVHVKIRESLVAHNLNYDKVIAMESQGCLEPSPNLTDNPTRSGVEPSTEGSIKSILKVEGGVGGSTPKQRLAFKVKKQTDLFKGLWSQTYLLAFGTVYSVTGVDSGQARLLFQDGKTRAQDLMKVVADAWAFKGKQNYYCSKTKSIAFFCNHINEIKHELYGTPSPVARDAERIPTRDAVYAYAKEKGDTVGFAIRWYDRQAATSFQRNGRNIDWKTELALALGKARE